MRTNPPVGWMLEAGRRREVPEAKKLLDFEYRVVPEVKNL